MKSDKYPQSCYSPQGAIRHESKSARHAIDDASRELPTPSNTQFEHGAFPPTLWGSYSAEQTALSLGPHMVTSASDCTKIVKF